jgi:predicted ATPase
MESRGFILHVEIVEKRVPSFDVYPFAIPAIGMLRNRLPLHAQATVFVGENGCGKSTLVEAIAVAAGLTPKGAAHTLHFQRAGRSPNCSVSCGSRVVSGGHERDFSCGPRAFSM